MSTVASLVDRATSDLLIGPDWGRNLELCDAVNSDPGQAKDVAKAVKKRLANKNPTIQLLTLTVLETLMKNCGDALHQQVAEKDILHEMVKIVKKRGDLAVRDKILGLLDSWQEAFGGQRGRYPQFFVAYDELRRSGVDFPQREDAVPIFTPPQTHPITAFPAPGFVPAPEPQLPLDVDMQRLSLGDLDSARSGMEILSEMLNAIDPRDKSALKQDLIVELVEQCQRSQKQVMNLVNTTSDETLLFQALAINDDLQKVLAKHDAVVSGARAHVARDDAVFTHEDDENEDGFAQLAHRSRQKSENSGPKPITPAQPQLVRIPGPPGHPTYPATNALAANKAPAVDLLSDDTLGRRTSTESKKEKAVHKHGVDESEENVNPFALQHSDENVNPFALQTASVSNGKSTSYQQEQPASLPPPPIKHSQRQQFFQQQQQQDQKVATDQEYDERMENPYAAIYRQQMNASSTQKQEQAQKPVSTSSSSISNNTQSLFSDLVDLQSARMKRGG